MVSFNHPSGAQMTDIYTWPTPLGHSLTQRVKREQQTQGAQTLKQQEPEGQQLPM